MWCRSAFYYCSSSTIFLHLRFFRILYNYGCFVRFLNCTVLYLQYALLPRMQFLQLNFKEALLFVEIFENYSSLRYLISALHLSLRRQPIISRQIPVCVILCTYSILMLRPILLCHSFMSYCNDFFFVWDVLLYVLDRIFMHEVHK